MDIVSKELKSSGVFIMASINGWSDTDDARESMDQHPDESDLERIDGFVTMCGGSGL